MPRLAFTAHDLDPLEAERAAQQALLDAQLTFRQRNEMGQFATPPLLADDIAKAAASFWNNGQEVRFFEPAVGTGSFYSALVRNFPRSQIASAVGIELDPGYAGVARQLWGPTGLEVIAADFMAATPPAKNHSPNLILANPPYVRHHHLTANQKGHFQKLASRVSGGNVSGLSGLYTYFILAAHEWLADDGLAAWLIPSEFMDVNYGESLRRYFSHRVSLQRIHRFDPSDAQFADALVSSSVVIFRRRTPPSNHLVQISYGGKVSEPHFCEGVPVASLQTKAKWSRLFNGNGSRAQEQGPTLSSLFTIKRGIATGANDFFILRRRKLVELGIHERFVRPILPPARYIKRNVIESDDAGFPVMEEQLAVIDTDLSIGQIRQECIGLWQYLEGGRKKEIEKAYLLAKRSPWYRQEQRPPAPFLCTYMGRTKDDGKTFRFFWNRSDATAANTYLLMYPVGQLKDAISANPELGLRVLSLLNDLHPAGFIEHGRVYGGGLFKMEPRELGRVDATPIVEDLNLAVSTQPNLIGV
jgi:adenine-specific DNA-methyltransferase